MLVIAAIISIPVVTFSQTAPVVQVSWTALQSLKPNASIVVMTKDGTETKGKFRSVSENAIVIGSGRKTKNLPRENIVAVYSTRKSVKKYTLVGTGIGAGAGTVLGAAAGGCGTRDLICFGRGKTIAVAAPLLALPGALVGFLIGEGRSQKILVYAAKP
jgi:hypothetical protein